MVDREGVTVMLCSVYAHPEMDARRCALLNRTASCSCVVFQTIFYISSNKVSALLSFIPPASNVSPDSPPDATSRAASRKQTAEPLSIR